LPKLKLLVCNFFLFSLSLLAVSEEPDYVINRKDMKESVTPGDVLVISNSIGDVRLRGGGNEDVEVHAVIQNLMKDTPSPEVIFKRDGKNLTLITTFTENPQGKPDRVDLVAYVPDKMNAQVETTSGEIEIKGLKDDISAISEKGKITIKSVMGHIQAKNDSGSISVELLPKVTTLPQEFTTTTGDISLFLSEGINADVSLQSSGEISTDFSLHIDFDGTKEPDKIAKSTIGKGGCCGL
jgi:putative adhesin